MNNLTRFDKDGIELVIDTTTGESFATVSGYARMSGLTQQAISKRYKQTHNQDIAKTAKILTVTGIKTVKLIPLILSAPLLIGVFLLVLAQ